MATRPDITRRPSSSNKQESVAGDFTLPIVHLDVTVEHAAYFGALGVLAALEIVEWPLAAVLVAGHVLANRAHRRFVKEFASGATEAM